MSEQTMMLFNCLPSLKKTHHLGFTTLQIRKNILFQCCIYFISGEYLNTQTNLPTTYMYTKHKIIISTIVTIWCKNMPGYLSSDIICSEKRTVFWERSSRKTVSYEEQIMSKDKYPSIFLPQMGTIVLIILQIFFATCAVLKIGEYSRIFPSFCWGIFGHTTRLNESRTSKKIWCHCLYIIQ